MDIIRNHLALARQSCLAYHHFLLSTYTGLVTVNVFEPPPNELHIDRGAFKSQCDMRKSLLKSTLLKLDSYSY